MTNKIIQHRAWIYLSLISVGVLLFSSNKFALLYEEKVRQENLRIERDNQQARLKYAQRVEEIERLKEEELAKIENGFGQTNLNQGVQVKIEAVEILDKTISFSNDLGIPTDYKGMVEHDANRFSLDPDLPNKGLPNLHISVLEPKPFSHKSFIDRLLNGSFRGATLWGNSETKVNSINWKTPTKTLLIEEHALQFALDVFTHFDDKNYLKDHGVKRKKNVFGWDLDKNNEWENRRYPPINIILSFTPQSPQLLKEPTVRSPAFAVSAVELIGNQAYRANKESMRSMGADKYLTIGATLPMYDRFESLPLEENKKKRSQVAYTKSAQESSQEILSLEGETTENVLNADYFGKKKYGVINISNIGTTSKGNIFIGREKASEAYRFIFALHLFVFGDWITPFRPLSEEWGALQQKKQVELTSSLFDRILSGLFDTFVPSLGLGEFGQGLIVLLLFLLLLPFIPALLQILQWIAGLISKIFRSPAQGA